MNHFKSYNSKKQAKEAQKNEQGVLCNFNCRSYFICKNLKQYVKLIKNEYQKDPEQTMYYEYISQNEPVNLFFDVEIYEGCEYFINSDDIVEIIKAKVNKHFNKYNCEYIVLDSHSLKKKSYHIIVIITDPVSKTQMLFNSVHEVKKVYFILKLDDYVSEKTITKKQYNIIDWSVYREGLFRTIYSTKQGEKRPLLKNEKLSTFEFTDIQTFVQISPKKHNIFQVDPDIQSKKSKSKNFPTASPIDQKLTKEELQVIENFVFTEYGQSKERIREIKVDYNLNCVLIPLNDTFCNFIEDFHSNNHQYIVIDPRSSKQKCHDEICTDKKYNDIPSKRFPIDLADILKNYLVVDEQEKKLIEAAEEDALNYLQTVDDQVDQVIFNRELNTFNAEGTLKSIVQVRGECEQCDLIHTIHQGGHRVSCRKCNKQFPDNNQFLPVPDTTYRQLNQYFQQNNNITININNYGENDFSCDIDIEEIILNDPQLSVLFNQAIDGHKIVKLAEILFKVNKDFKYCNEKWYYFKNSIWNEDNESIQMKHEIVKIGDYLNKIYRHYENNSVYKVLLRSVKSLNTKLYKPAFESEIVTGAKLFYLDQNFSKLLNHKKHLLPFKNGVYDLIKNEFRQTQRDDYINLTVGYDYRPEIENKEVYTFIEQILPDREVRDFVLKKMADCLNGDIPNTTFMMLIGNSGANGKSQLLNLMKIAMGEFAEKMEVTLLTRKRNNANEASSEKIKLLNKRFAFLSEPEDGEKINIGLLKELTGSEEIVARGLYQDSLTFIMETKLFLACNELPQIKGEDNALWRRIRVVDFPSKFVLNPNPDDPTEFKMDQTIPTRMREDPSWRTTFINILISYYYKDIPVPETVKVSTNEYKEDNNKYENWFNENLEYKKGSSLQLKEITEKFDNKLTRHQKTQFKEHLEKWIKLKNIDSMYKHVNGQRGFKNLQFIEDY